MKKSQCDKRQVAVRPAVPAGMHMEVWNMETYGKRGQEAVMFDLVVVFDGIAIEIRCVRLFVNATGECDLALPIVKSTDRYMFSVNLPESIIRGARVLAEAEYRWLQQRRAGLQPGRIGANVDSGG